MLYLLHGQDFKKSREKLRSLISALLKKEPNALEFKIDSYNFSENLLNEMIESQSLFAGRYIVVLDSLFQDEGDFLDDEDEIGGIDKILLKELKNIANSPNIFIFIEKEPTKAVLSRFQKWAEKIQEFSVKGPQKLTEKFNIFSLTDALGRRDKKSAWVLYQRALAQGLVPEKIHGTIFWHFKNLLMVKDEENLQELGLSPFVLRKSIGFAERFKKEELIKIGRELVEIPHNARRGLEDFGVSLEKFILSL